MADNTIYLFGASGTALAAYLPQIAQGSGALLTDTRVTRIVTNNAAVVCGALRAGGFDPAAIDADNTSDTFSICQRLVCHLSVPELLQAVNLGPGSQATERAYKAALAELERIRANPAQLGQGTAGKAPGTRLNAGTTPRRTTRT